MRTTIRLDPEVFVQAKLAAAKAGRSLTALIEDSLRETLNRRTGSKIAYRVQLTTSPGGLRPGVDLDDSAGLWDVLDQAPK